MKKMLCLIIVMLVCSLQGSLVYFPTGATNSFSTASSISQNWTFGKFDPALGTLIAVHFIDTIGLTGTLAIENLSSHRINNALAGLDISLALTGIMTETNSWDGTYSVNKYDGTADFSGRDSYTWTGINSSSNWNYTLTNNLSSYQGTNNVTVLSSVQRYFDAHGNSIGFQANTLSTGSFVVYYEYGPAGVPELNSTGWIAIGFLVMPIVCGSRIKKLFLKPKRCKL
ncbi:MAG: choice-of-anchor E domain-containing protein [Candidatus Staskawiczbacteria bacterium]|nr:choice-of-anchor E domain-containing protein [Candidatus Staskawiczbacteria bacterium]